MVSALEGIRVLDLTIWQQGPYASAMLADLGADVIKIEAPDSPDPGRRFLFRRELGLSPYYEAHNRGKRALALDLKHPKGKELFFRLAKGADVFLHNLRGGAVDRLGLGYEVVSKVNPRIIYAHASAWGGEGPDVNLGSYDILAQARGGVMMLNGEPDGPPLPVPVPIADQVGAMVAAYGIVVALLHRERTGQGQELNVSLLGSQLALQSFNVTSYLLTGRLPLRQPRGGFGPLWAVYKGSDGKHLALAMLEDRWWPGVCQAIGEPELESDSRFDTAQKRFQNAEELTAHLDEAFARRPAREWVRCFQEHGLMAASVQDYEDLANDPQVIANAYIQEVERPGHQPVRMVGVPVKFSKTPGEIRRLGPALGEHTHEVLLECGLTREEIGELEAEGVIRQAGPGAD
jgi:crotonobetainyl-CoA:carnitine CoA-transferase CaiB-like acyl-CoA transferase